MQNANGQKSAGHLFGFSQDFDPLQVLEMDGHAADRGFFKNPHGLGRGVGFFANGFQFAMVEPGAGTLGTAIQNNASAEAEEFAFEFDATTPHTFPDALRIHGDGGIANDFRQRLFAGGNGVIQLGEFCGVEPDAAAAILANVQQYRPGFHPDQLAVTGGTFHDGK
jgi:hypothetical protein